MPSAHPFAVLAPVPLEHLESGLALCEVGQKVIAYGTNKWELLGKIDKMRGKAPVAMLIYPSHEGIDADPSCIVGWFGRYVGQQSPNLAGRHPDAATMRPPSTVTDGKWAAFWHIDGLRRLPKEKQLGIGKIQGFRGGWRKEAPPRGPELVTLPDLYFDEH